MTHRKLRRYQFGGFLKAASAIPELGEAGYRGFTGAPDEYGVFKSDIGPAIGTTIFKPYRGTALSAQHFAEAKTPGEKFKALASVALLGSSAYEENKKRRQSRDEYLSQLQDIEAQRQYEGSLGRGIFSEAETPEIPELLKTNRATVAGGVGAVEDIFKGHYGGQVPINIERKELEVRNGKIIRDFKAKPLHPKDKNLIDLDGTVLATSGNIIIPADKRKRYLEGDSITKNTIEAQVRRDQVIRNREGLETFGKGGKISASKAKEILRHGEVRGHPLTDKQKRFFGLLAGGKQLTKAQEGVRVPEGYSTIYDQPGYTSGYDPFGFPTVYSYQGTPIRGLSEQEFLDLPEEAFTQEMRAAGYQQPMPVSPTTTYANYTVDTGIKTPSTDKEKSRFDFGQAGLDFTQYAPALYNVGMGLFGGKSIPDVPPIYNPRRERITELMRQRQVNLDPILRDIELSEATGERAIREASAGTPGLYIAGRTALSNATQRSKAKARMEADLINQGYRADEANVLVGLGASEAAADETARAMKIAFQANLAKYLPTGLGQASQIAQLSNRDRILKEEFARRKEEARRQAYIR